MTSAPRLRHCSVSSAVALALASLFPISAGAASDDVLARSRALYASLKSYADTGTVVYEYGMTNVSRHTFRT